MQENRDSYHHGDLRRALLEVGLERTRQGGPDAVTLREATRAVGVSVNAAYRHFDGLEGYLGAIAQACQAKLSERIESSAIGLSGAALLRAVGIGYVAFALDEPGWFATAFHVPRDLALSADPASATPGGRTPFVLLNDALDQMVEAGEMAPGRRPGAEVFCWSAVHGFSQLALGGPLRALPREQADALAGLVVENSISGIAARAAR